MQSKHHCPKQTQAAHWTWWLMQDHPALVNAMRETSHHFNSEQLNPWHLEGDVWVHTMLVLQAYVRSAQSPDPCLGVESQHVWRWMWFLGLVLTLLVKLHYEKFLLKQRFSDYARYLQRSYKLLPWIY